MKTCFKILVVFYRQPCGTIFNKGQSAITKPLPRWSGAVLKLRLHFFQFSTFCIFIPKCHVNVINKNMIYPLQISTPFSPDNTSSPFRHLLVLQFSSSLCNLFDKLNTLGGSFLMLNNEYIHILQPVTAVLTKLVLSEWELSDTDCCNQNIPLLQG